MNQHVDADYLRQLLVDFVRTPTPQTELYEKDPQITRFISGSIMPELQKLKLHPTIDGFGNLICRLASGKKGNRLMLVAYAMTYPAATMKDPFSGRIIDGKPYGLEGQCVRGRGVSEQKAVMAAMIGAIKCIVDAEVRLNGELIFVASTAGETGRHDSIKYVIEEDKVTADAAIVGLGTSNRICPAHKGRVDIFITIRGKSCHSSTPWLGANAIDGAFQLLNLLKESVKGRIEPHLGEATLAVTAIDAEPKAPHTIPGRCILTIDRRLLPGDDPDLVTRNIQRICFELKGFSVQVEKGPCMYPSRISTGSHICKLVAEAVRSALMKKPEYVYLHGSLDAGYLNRMGLPALMFGPGDMAFAHTDEEIVPLLEVEGASKVYAYSALRMFGHR
ncbi:MAG: M20/M25/M40 family metallo-hydrolase [Thaumarchaeota archaeon]|nr:M20/M25/M40 family metallo-hydrolase [Nitrososphaerota archaeon]